MADADYKFVASTGSGYTGYGGPINGDYTTGTSDMGLFDDISPSEAQDGYTDYRCLYLRYVGGTSATGCVAWFTNVAIDQGSISVATGEFNTAADYIGPPGTGVPSNVGTFTNITTYNSRAAGLDVGTGNDVAMVSGDYRVLWLKRVIPSSSPGDSDEHYYINFGGESTS